METGPLNIKSAIGWVKEKKSISDFLDNVSLEKLV